MVVAPRSLGGEHSLQALREELGLTDAQVAALVRRGGGEWLMGCAMFLAGEGALLNWPYLHVRLLCRERIHKPSRFVLQL